MTTKKPLPRGIRNKNPGNIEHNPRNKWQGLASPPAEPEGRFARFTDPTFGIRALARTLITYFDKYDCNTVRLIVNRWAPAVENNTAAYTRALCDALKALPNELLDLHDYRTLRPLVVAIIKHENGVQPYTAAQIDKGLLLAGVQPPKPSLKKDRTLVGGSVAGTAAVASEVVTEVKDQIEPLAYYAESLRVILLVIVFVGIGLTLWQLAHDRKRGIR